jgi:Domain of unknown function (DUF4399)
MGITRRVLLSAPLLLLLPKRAGAQKTPSPNDAVLYFISPTDGATIRGPFDVRFGLKNMGVTHAGDVYPNSGHHHLLIDVGQPLDVKEPIPRDKNHLHFGAGETETRIELPPGEHTLQLVLGDAKHYPFDPPVVSDKISITVLPERGHAKRAEREKGEEGEKEKEKEKGGGRRHRRRRRPPEHQQRYQQPYQQQYQQPYQQRNRGHGGFSDWRY